MLLQARLDAFTADYRAGKAPYFAPPDIHPIMERATAELIAARQAERALRAGHRVPAFILNGPHGRPVSSLGLLEQGPLVISFCRGGWCPYGNIELQALEAALPAIRAQGANLVAISPQDTVHSRRAVRANRLSFPILSDAHNAVAAAFGLRFALPDYLIELYRQLKNDLPAFNGDTSWTLPIPARYVVDQGGVILYSEVNPDYTQRPEPEDLLPALRQAKTSSV
jgi:peroxiredoxin